MSRTRSRPRADTLIDDVNMWTLVSMRDIWAGCLLRVYPRQFSENPFWEPEPVYIVLVRGVVKEPIPHDEEGTILREVVQVQLIASCGEDGWKWFDDSEVSLNTIPFGETVYLFKDGGLADAVDT